jgi:hypothetical protein
MRNSSAVAESFRFRNMGRNFLLPILFAFILTAPVLADTYANTVLATTCPDVTGIADDTYVVLQNDLDCSASGWKFDNENTVAHIKVNLNGYTINTGSLGLTVAGDVYDGEAYGGTILSTGKAINFAPNCEVKSFFLHDLTLNGSIFSQNGGQCGDVDDFYLKDSTVNVDSLPFIDASSGAVITFENVEANCIAGTCYDIKAGSAVVFGGSLTFKNFRMNGFSVPVSTNRIGQASIELINASLASENPFDYSQTGSAGSIKGLMKWVKYDALTLTAKDQNNANIDAMAKIKNVNPTAKNPFKDRNPTDDVDFGINNGLGTIFLVKNITWIGEGTSPTSFTTDYKQYNVTVKSRGKSQSKIVIFSSPASESFALDFTSEDTGTNVVIDQRTIPEKTGNAITGLISFLSPLAMIFAPLLMLI